jgi:hypothetical protein
MADMQAVQSNGDAHELLSRGAPWLPIKMLYPLVAGRPDVPTPFRKLFPHK